MLLKLLFLLLVSELHSVYPDSRLFRSRTRAGFSCPWPVLKNGRIRQRPMFQVVRFTCSFGYELVGNKYAHCSNGNWDAPLPVCIRPGCTVPSVKNSVPISTRQSAYVMYFCLPGYTLQGSQALFCDGESWNSSAPACVSSNSSQVQNNLSCDFEDPDICGWNQDRLHDFDWTRLNKRTPSSFLFTGPTADHTLGEGESGYYMYIESSSRNENDSARLLSPVYDQSLVKDGCFSFYYHMYGRSIGGLRVYQKPDKLDLESLLNLNAAEKDKYILFERWGNVGNEWLRYVANLTDVADDFQIVIEGIRGKSVTSDIAIDDVAILQGANCTLAMESAMSTTITTSSDSCAGRCNDVGKRSACSCNNTCIMEMTCCSDFFDYCFFADSTTPIDESSIMVSQRSKEMPQTQKLVGSTPGSRATDTTPVKPITRATTQPTKPSTTTTPKITTTPTLPTKLTTIKPKVTTMISSSKSTLLPTSSTSSTVKVKLTTPEMKATTTKSVKLTTIKGTTDLPQGISRTFENHDSYHELVEKAKTKEEIEGLRSDKKSEPPKSSSGGVKVTAIVITSLVSLVAAAYAAVFLRSERGRNALARLQGRARADPEVRYLTGEDD